MPVSYEWIVETETSAASEEYEAGEVLDHRCFASFAAARDYAASGETPDGCHLSVVLVRDDDKGREWAYMGAGSLHEYFSDAYGTEGTRVPKRYAVECNQ